MNEMPKALSEEERRSLSGRGYGIAIETGRHALAWIDAASELLAAQAAQSVLDAQLLQEVVEGHEEDPDGNIGTELCERIKAHLAGPVAALANCPFCFHRNRAGRSHCERALCGARLQAAPGPDGFDDAWTDRNEVE